MESNLVVAFLRDFVRVWQRRGTLARLRVFFPDKVELGLAVGGAGRSSDGIPAPDNTFTAGPFAAFPGRCSWLCEQGLLTTSGLGRLLKMLQPAAERTAPDDVAIVVAYPSLNIDEMTEVAALHAARPDVPIITVNAELERIRSGYGLRNLAALLPCSPFLTPFWLAYTRVIRYYPFFWAKGEMDALRAFAPRFEQAYFIHNFKARVRAPCFALVAAYRCVRALPLRRRRGQRQRCFSAPTPARSRCCCAARTRAARQPSASCTPAQPSRGCAPSPPTSSPGRWPRCARSSSAERTGAGRSCLLVVRAELLSWH